MIKTDYHCHTSYSFDSKACMESMVKQAIEMGLEEIAITDHIDFSYPDKKIVSPKGVCANVEAILAARQVFGSQIRLAVGVELGLRADCAEKCREIAAGFDFDIVIGSVHETAFGVDFYYPELYKNHPKHEAYQIYFESVLSAVSACDSYDVLGHLDFVERYAPYDDKNLRYADFCDIIDEILRIIIGKGIGLEVNTSGLSYGLGRTHPQPAILRRYLELGGEIITVGSDAHAPERIGYGFDVVLEILNNLGIKYIARFERRKPVFDKT